VAKTQYYTATTLDGFIADENNSLGWLFEVDREQEGENSFDAFFADIGAMAMGATTYEWVLDHDGCSRSRTSGVATTEIRPAGSSRTGRSHRFPRRESTSSRAMSHRYTKR
jgi:dihydrofolate reductase